MPAEDHDLPTPPAPLRWWVPHLVGVLLVQTAFWFGVWRFAADEPFPQAFHDGTTEPAQMIGQSWPCAACLLLLGWPFVFCALFDETPRRRAAWWVLVYALLAGCWAAAAEFAATPLDL